MNLTHGKLYWSRQICSMNFSVFFFKRVLVPRLCAAAGNVTVYYYDFKYAIKAARFRENNKM